MLTNISQEEVLKVLEKNPHLDSAKIVEVLARLRRLGLPVQHYDLLSPFEPQPPKLPKRNEPEKGPILRFKR